MTSGSSKRARKRHVQQALFRRGGKRRGAGRKPMGARAGERHAVRSEFKPYHPLHVVVRVAPAVGSLRRRKMYRALREATITAAMRERFRIIHASLQRTHIHLLIEADHKAALARGMQGFLISAARHINTALGDGMRRRRGKVFADRYHVEVITTPTQARHTLSYVLINRPIPSGGLQIGRLTAGNWPVNHQITGQSKELTGHGDDRRLAGYLGNNWRKHQEDREGIAATWLVDPFSSGILFPDWKELQDKAFMWPIRATYDPLIVVRPKTWLLAEGWKRAGGGPISARDVPSQSR